MSKKIGILLFVMLSLVSANMAVADIYMFIDSEGIVHFTNVPTSTDYKLYIKEKPEKTVSSSVTQEYDEIIRKAHKRFGVEFSLIKAVIKVESGFNPMAVSRKGAKGLMQIMPSNFDSLFVVDPFNPSQNIMAGARYLQQLLRRYEHKLPLVLAAYNAGPEAVDRYKQIPPFKETQNYVRKVMETYSQYKDS